jgi:hypothetical protein
MNAKAIMTIALRLMGFWILFVAVAAMVNLVTILYASLPPGAGSLGQSSLLVENGFALLANASLAAALLLFAPAIASWFSAESTASVPVTDRPTTVRDVYIIAARLLGIYSLVSAVPALQRLARYTLDYKFNSGPAGEYIWAGLVEASMYLAGGAFLIFFASGIAALFSRAHGMSDRPTTDNVSRSHH